VSYFQDWIFTTIATNGGGKFCDHLPVLPSPVVTSYNDNPDLKYTMLNNLQWVLRNGDKRVIEPIVGEWIFGLTCAYEAMMDGMTTSGEIKFGEIDKEQMVACGKCFDLAYTREASMACSKKYIYKTYGRCQKLFDSNTATESETLPCMLESVKYYSLKKHDGWNGLENTVCPTMDSLLEDMVLFMKGAMRMDPLYQ
jgi:hypothetical protein